MFQVKIFLVVFFIMAIVCTGNSHAVGTDTPTPAMSMTITPVMSPTSTPSVTNTITSTLTMTLTSTPTITATRTPYTLARGQVIAYPIPAKGDDAWFYYYVEKPSVARIRIYNLAGEQATMLLQRQEQIGYCRTHWNIRSVAPGVYLYRLTLENSGGLTSSALQKILIVK